MSLSWFIKMCSNNPGAQYSVEFADSSGASDSPGSFNWTASGRFIESAPVLGSLKAETLVMCFVSSCTAAVVLNGRGLGRHPAWLDDVSLVLVTVSSIADVHHSCPNGRLCITLPPQIFVMWALQRASKQLSQPNKTHKFHFALLPKRFNKAFRGSLTLIWWSTFKCCSADLAQAIFSRSCSYSLSLSYRLWEIITAMRSFNSVQQ